ncbi:hypothetical protein Pst134EA_025467 [Puccinia striiformis f. sp. tritici]|uniref:hypothetical protein n=2 Tax=Puccinia striiformis f. sp. tritici TaxID=168172 RepID=UPI002008BE7F|nr:hypothetical protein Pst134EA_025467 [Puccinia striiformis f. sp. tritici]KAH9451517.1 hypothetical protein Pst134EA_025467 [Puccinia striiformis f. sp. tritici]
MRMEREMGQESGEKSTECYEAPLNRQESIDPRAEREAVRRSDWIILPITFLYSFLSHLDRSNLGNARVAGLQESLDITDYQFSIALTMTFVPYVLAELPVTLLLKRVGAHIMIPLLVTLWGLVTTFQGFVYSYKGLLATRFFLGAVEGGLYPATVLFVSNSYKRNEIQFRISLFSSAAALSGALSGVFAFYLIQLDGVCNIPGWGWIFLVEGIFTTLCGVAGFFIFPRSISTCRLLTPEQRRIMSTRLEMDRPLEAQETEERFSWYQMCCALKSPHVLLASAALFMIGSNLYGLAYFEPSIVKSFGYSPRITQLVSVPPFAVGFISMLLTSYLSDRYGARGITAILMGLIAFAGYLMFMISNSDSFRYFSLFLSVAGIYSASPTMYAWLANNSAPHYRKASAIALGPIAANSGGILSTWLFPSSQQPRYPTATIVNLCFSAGIAILCSLNLLWLRSCNKKKAAQIEETVVLTEKGQSTAKNLDDGEWLRLGDKCQNFRYAY